VVVGDVQIPYFPVRVRGIISLGGVVRIKKSLDANAFGEIMARLKAARASTDGHSVRWHGFAPDVLIPVLESFVEFQDLVPEADRREVIRDAVYNAARETNFGREELLKNLEESEKHYLRKLPEKFIGDETVALERHHGFVCAKPDTLRPEANPESP
jgi:hypothetical protein